MPVSTKPKDILVRDSSSLLDGVKERVKSLSPAYFGMVMATGIVSIAAHMLGLSLIAVALFWLTIVAYLVLWLLNVLRAIWFARDFFSDMVNHQRGMGFFTIVAGSCVLGSQFVLIAENYQVATYLWVLALVLWIGLTYTIFTAFSLKII